MLFLVQNSGRPRKCAEHQSVPGSENLVIAMRADSFRAGDEHFIFGRRKQWLIRISHVRIDNAQNILPRQRLRVAVVKKISFRGDPEISRGDAEFLDRKQLGKLFPGPAIEFSFLAFAVGVFGGKKSAVRMRHVPQDVIQNVADNFRVPRVAADCKSVEVKLRELRVIIEHFFEMGHEPFSIYGIARKAAAELIMDAARRHFVAGVQAPS